MIRNGSTGGRSGMRLGNYLKQDKGSASASANHSFYNVGQSPSLGASGGFSRMFVSVSTVFFEQEKVRRT